MTLRPERIVLVGFMGAGKSTVGPALATALGWRFCDMDEWIEERTGHTVADLFRERGEVAFREEERRLAVEVGRLENYVIAAGGGAFARDATRAVLRARAVTVWLRCDLDTLLARIPRDGSRPLASSRERMQQLLAEREPSYRMADISIDTSGAAPEEVARRIIECVFTRQAATGEPDRS